MSIEIVDPTALGHQLEPYSDGRIWEEHVVLAEIICHTETIIHSAYEIGRRLIWTKEVVGHGRFGDWCSDHLPFSERTIRDYMRVADFLAKHPALLKPLGRAGLKKTLLLTSLPQEVLEEMVGDGHMAEVPVEMLGDVPYVELKKTVEQLKKALEKQTEVANKAENKVADLTMALGQQTAERSQFQEFAAGFVAKDGARLKAEIERLASHAGIVADRWPELTGSQRADVVGLMEGLHAQLEYELLRFRTMIGDEVYGHQLAEVLQHAEAVGHAVPDHRVLPFAAGGR